MPLNVSSASLQLTLPSNALAGMITVKVQADSAGSIALSDVGQVRTQTSSDPINSGGTTAVIDFGIPLTVSGAQAAAGSNLTIRAVYRWRGDSFDPTASWTNAQGTTLASFSEISTARLKLELNGTGASANAGTVLVNLPALPSDLELTVNGGSPVWRSPGPRPAPDTDGWTTVGTAPNTVTQKDVDITEAIAPLLANPDGSGKLTKVTVELRVRTPGKLGLVTGTQDYDLLQRVQMFPDSTVVFDTEGEQYFTLFVQGSPSTALKEVWLTLSSQPPKERAVPAVGPERVTEVELVMDSGRSACVRFPKDIMAELTSLRLPLRAQDSTAEVRAQLLAPLDPDDPAKDEPGPPLDGPSASEPVELEPPPSQRGFGAQQPQTYPDSWVELPFKKPVPLKTAFWVSLQVTRGTVRWSLGKANVAQGEVPYKVRRGAPTGPWLPLPAAVLAIPGIGGRLHTIGHPPKEAPLAPLQLEIIGPSYTSGLTEVSPTAKGVTVKLAVASSIAQQSYVRMVSRSTTTVAVQSLIRVIAKP